MLTALLMALGLGSAGGCYYGHLAGGQLRIWRAQQPIDRVLENPDTPAELRRRLELTADVREFAAGLGLAIDGQYTRYLPWDDDRLVTNVVATRPREIEPAGFRFLLVGRLPYKGFFDRARAEAEAERLRAQGLDVCVTAVAAYSTLGWLDDPLTSPMVQPSRSDDRFVELLLHELVHATVFVRNEADFNEGAALFIGQEAAVRFFADRGDATQASATRDRVVDDRAVAAELLGLRERIAELYASDTSDAEVEERRRALGSETRAALAASSFRVRSAADVARSARLGDACLALGGTYAADLERHAEVLAALDGDLTALIERLRQAAETDDPRARYFGSD